MYVVVVLLFVVCCRFVSVLLFCVDFEGCRAAWVVVGV